MEWMGRGLCGQTNRSPERMDRQTDEHVSDREDTQAEFWSNSSVFTSYLKCLVIKRWSGLVGDLNA